jgi:hypothetical protein
MDESEKGHQKAYQLRTEYQPCSNDRLLMAKLIDEANDLGKNNRIPTQEECRAEIKATLNSRFESIWNKITDERISYVKNIIIPIAMKLDLAKDRIEKDNLTEELDRCLERFSELFKK